MAPENSSVVVVTHIEEKVTDCGTKLLASRLLVPTIENVSAWLGAAVTHTPEKSHGHTVYVQ